MQLINIMYFLLPFLTSNSIHSNESLKDPIFICYGKISPESIKGYQIVVLESQHYNEKEIALFKKNNTKVLAYLSATEVNEYSFFYNDIKQYTLGNNNTWNSHYIDIKNPKAQQILLNAIETINKKGFNGLFLDNLDNVSKWGELPSQKNNLISFLQKIKKRNSNFYLIQNSGLFIAEELKNTINAILIESVVTKYNFKEKKYELRDEESKTILLNNLKKVNKPPIFILEYADTKQMKERISKELKKIGYNYFIAQIDLQSIPEFIENKK